MRKTIHTKRVYDEPAKQDGYRVLVDRIWPRGVAKESAGIDLWLKEIAPSTELRQWFGHDPARWDEFQDRYRSELATGPGADAVAALGRRAAGGTVTLVFSSRDLEHNNAVVLKQLLDRRRSSAATRTRRSPRRK